MQQKSMGVTAAWCRCPQVSRTNSTNPMEWGGLCRDGFGTREAQVLCEYLFPGSE